LKREILDGRSPERVRAHYEAEKRLANKLRASARAERAEIYGRMYRELFAEIPDHPRLVRREDPEASRVATNAKLRFLAPYLRDGAVVGEFGAGDCRFSIEVAKHAGVVFAIDIADQSGGATAGVRNLKQVIYDGFDLPIDDATIDVMISDQLLEHLHPDDIGLHLAMIRRVLRPGGVYLIRTPHAFTGPHDVSKYFSDVAEGFHLKEWTYRELTPELAAAGFSRVIPLRTIRQRPLHPPAAWLRAAEAWLARVSPGRRRQLARVFVKEVCVAAYR
jgi:SAM-dependent methyltransferase